MTQIFHEMHSNSFQHECIPISEYAVLYLEEDKQQKDQKMKTVRHDQASSEDLQCP